MVVYFSQMEKNTGIIAPPETWIGYSICNLLCCCCPLGVVSVIFSVMTESANNGGDYSKASKYSKLAAWFNIAGISLGSFVFFGSIIFVLVKNGMPWNWAQSKQRVLRANFDNLVYALTRGAKQLWESQLEFGEVILVRLYRLNHVLPLDFSQTRAIFCQSRSHLVQ